MNQTCNKKTYPDKKTAQTVRNDLMRKRHRMHGAKNLRIYPHPQCRGWHLTKT
jgi:hypothetical protein